ncbi:MAG TPA: hydrogenase maturation nickel metallochaperone HypA [Candidatus Aphodousia gallistercoris]|nr:hydrogenase maturation nickel metallochaperone HypA [Candidatus Aphodousia gallistercoris]
MHELSIAEGIVDIVERTAKANGLAKVKTVRVAIGRLAGVEVDSLRFAWISARMGSAAAEAELVIEEPEGKAWCMDCARTVALPRFGEACPHCGGYHLTPTDGMQMKVLDIVGEG